MSKGSKKSESKKQTEIIISVSLIVLAVVFVYIGFSVPRVSNDYQTTAESLQTAPSFSSDISTQSSQSADDSSASYNAQSGSSSVSFPINLNTCTASDLMKIDGVGETRANAIIAYRDYLGGYTSVEQLKNISGIGDSVYAKIEPYVTV